MNARQKFALNISFVVQGWLAMAFLLILGGNLSGSTNIPLVNVLLPVACSVFLFAVVAVMKCVNVTSSTR